MLEVMKVAIIAMGIPGSGKTTLLAPFAEKHGLKRISRDEIREEMFGDPLDRSSQGVVWEEANRRMYAALGECQGVVLDSTFATREKRTGIIADLRAAGADRIIGVLFTTPLDVAKKWNHGRIDAPQGHVVKESVMDTVHAQLAAEPPELAEGFDALYTSDQLDELESRELSH